MDKQTELQQWIEIADKDFALAEYASKNMWPVPVEQICFHCQQTAEKYLKWFLVLHDAETARGAPMSRSKTPAPRVIFP